MPTRPSRPAELVASVGATLMAEYQVRSPVVLVLFNRPDLTRLVVERIRLVRPSRLMVIADGPRPGVAADLALCAQARAVLEEIDWPCQVFTDFAERNEGVRLRISGGMGRVFEQEEQAIVLEDDCLPDLSFFRFCDDLLDRYEGDDRVMMITGTNIGETWKPELQSYHFARCANMWGWASWRRAWRHYDSEMRLWGRREVRRKIRRELGRRHFEALAVWVDFSYVRRKEWSLPWLVSILARSGLSIVPAVNLVSNLGFRSDPTLTKVFRPGVSALPTHTMAFPLRHPQVVAADEDYDERYWRIRHPPAPLLDRLRGVHRSLRHTGWKRTLGRRWGL